MMRNKKVWTQAHRMQDAKRKVQPVRWISVGSSTRNMGNKIHKNRLGHILKKTHIKHAYFNASLRQTKAQARHMQEKAGMVETKPGL